MATKNELQNKESACKTVLDYISIINEALTEPKDIDYAKELLNRAEGICQLPLDYIKIAEIYIEHFDDKDYAGDLYEEAEGACFEALEFAEVGHSIAKFLGDKEKAKELLENAADSAKKTDEILKIANYVLQDIGDEELAKKLFGKVEAQCKQLDDYLKLATSLVNDRQMDLAKEIYKKAENKIDGIEETVNYALKYFELFGEKDRAISILVEQEEEAQFTKEFIQIANGYNSLPDCADKVKEMLEKAEEFAMTGDENTALGLAYWQLLKDKDSSATAFEKGLKDLNDKQQLIDFAKIIATELGMSELAKKFYQRAESKMTSANELINLADAILNDIADKELARQIYERAESSINEPNELIIIAENAINKLNDKEFALKVYNKALNNAEKFAVLMNITQSAGKILQDDEFNRIVVDKLLSNATGTNELIEVVNVAIEILKDKEFAEKVLLKAEEEVTNLPEMKSVTTTVDKYFSDNEEWVKRVQEKLKKREENQSKYEEFQKREANVKFFKDYLVLLDDMMAELQDKYYAKKILQTAENFLDNSFFDIGKYERLMDAIRKYELDDNWVEKIFDKLFNERIKFHFDFHKLIELLLKFYDKERALNIASDYLQKYEYRIDSKSVRTIYDYTDLAITANDLLGNSNYSLKLIEKASKLQCSYLELVYLSRLAEKFGDDTASSLYLQQALAQCQSANEVINLTKRLLALGYTTDKIKALYNEAGKKISDRNNRIEWIKGVVDIFEDKHWAKEELNKIAKEFTTEFEKEEFKMFKERLIA